MKYVFILTDRTVIQAWLVLNLIIVLHQLC